MFISNGTFMNGCILCRALTTGAEQLKEPVASAARYIMASTHFKLNMTTDYAMYVNAIVETMLKKKL